MKELVDIFKALSDETRIQIMALLLLQGELCVCDVEGALGITQSKSSRHLRYLLNAGLVENRREGVWMHYRIPEQRSDQHRHVVRALEDALAEEDLQGLKTRLSAWWAEKSKMS